MHDCLQLRFGNDVLCKKIQKLEQILILLTAPNPASVQALSVSNPHGLMLPGGACIVASSKRAALICIENHRDCTFIKTAQETSYHQDSTRHPVNLEVNLQIFKGFPPLFDFLKKGQFTRHVSSLMHTAVLILICALHQRQREVVYTRSFHMDMSQSCSNARCPGVACTQISSGASTCTCT